MEEIYVLCYYSSADYGDFANSICIAASLDLSILEKMRYYIVKTFCRAETSDGIANSFYNYLKHINSNIVVLRDPDYPFDVDTAHEILEYSYDYIGKTEYSGKMVDYLHDEDFKSFIIIKLPVLKDVEVK